MPTLIQNSSFEVKYTSPEGMSNYEYSTDRPTFLASGSTVRFNLPSGTTLAQVRFQSDALTTPRNINVKVVTSKSSGEFINKTSGWTVSDDTKKYSVDFLPNSNDGFYYGFSIQNITCSYIEVTFPDNFLNDWAQFPNLKFFLFYVAPTLTNTITGTTTQTSTSTTTTTATETTSTGGPSPDPVVSPLASSGLLASVDITSEQTAQLLYTVPEKKKAVVNINACLRSSSGADITFYLGRGSSPSDSEMIKSKNSLPQDSRDDMRRDTVKRSMKIGSVVMVAGDKLWVKVKKPSSTNSTSVSNSGNTITPTYNTVVSTGGSQVAATNTSQPIDLGTYLNNFLKTNPVTSTPTTTIVNTPFGSTTIPVSAPAPTVTPPTVTQSSSNTGDNFA